MKRLLIVAEDSLVAHSIRLALQETSGFEVASVAVAPEPAASRARPEQRDRG